MVLVTEPLRKAPNFAVKREGKCMNCSKPIESGTDIYSRRFCSRDCMLEYLL